MAKSPRFQPGDSAPDFSHLADHDPDPDEPPWQPGGDASASPADAAEDPPASAPRPPDPRPPRDQANAGPADPPVSDSHVFFDTDEPVSENDLAGETTAYTPPHQRPAGSTDDRSQAVQLDDAGDECVLNAPPNADDPPLRVSADNATQLTDVGIPVFQDPPGILAAHAGDAGRAAPAAGMDPAADSDTDEDEDEPAAPQLFAAAGAVPPQFVGDETAPPEPTPAALSPTDPTVAAAAGRAAAAASPTRPARSSTASKPAPAAGERQRLLLILLASYASAITIAFVWLWLTRSDARPHELENLPDVAPLGPNEFRYAPQNASMPRGHTLPLGAQRQLGYIRVEPLRVTRGPVLFAHYSDPSHSKPPTEPVLKLWLRFTNVSSDQLIAPLDAELLLTRSYQIETDSVLANQLLLSADKSSHKPAYVIDHPTTSEWDLAGQKLGHRLAPGESLETYIPLEPGSDAHLTGELLWRVHFRKGYHDATGHGVTTMIEVPFSTTDIQPEPATRT